MSIPESPQNPGPFPAQHGYVDVQAKTHKYKDEPTALPGQPSKAQQFISSKTDRQHQKKYGKKALNFLMKTLCK
ncbi:hypothetical protein METBIDRAFT_39912 [Metschnikowia bicuspidata var. bicuspidata NRRL YB-4993]|uniref:Uncharacterized protein n=1 Tax=Metschnikowia bicuspidata var. bicuspidata NRRL YB-4993 TaxID=869754 RepID=A0A1A0HEP3_9ASCO|nr:hypothetical protein METBIDRAFT_39912 [Metschnikowia bicuspidata var. bicuspidata NRRL YB-4993]OBA22471.1 hypothetical protein METBIDRAFT_39912 [Metschnikowia bicuspidata var. bicuspidata NRRL YB-4993]